jgi:hypothetical protein
VKALGAVLFELDDALTGNAVEYAIGGALALAYYAEPRGTRDIDLNVSTHYSPSADLVTLFSELGWSTETDPATSLPIAGVRFTSLREDVVIDVCFSFDPYHAAVLHNAVRRPFLHRAERRDLPFLAANDLAVFKVSFNRTRDWADLEAMLEAGTHIDPDYVEQNLVGFRGPTAYPAIARLRRLIESRGAAPQ